MCATIPSGSPLSPLKKRPSANRPRATFTITCIRLGGDSKNHQQAEEVVGGLFRDWVRNPELLPNAYFAMVEHRDGAPRVVADYIAGMTDSFILEHWRER